MKRSALLGIASAAVIAAVQARGRAAAAFAVGESVDTRSGSLNHVRFSLDGMHFVTSSASGAGVIYTAAGAERARVAAQRAPMFNARFDAAGRQIVTTSYDGTLARWTLDGARLALHHPKSAAIIDAIFMPGDHELLFSSDDGSTTLGTLETARLWSIERPGTARNLAITRDGSLVAATSDAGLVTLVGRDGAVRGEVETGQGRLNSVAFAPNGLHFVTAGRDGVVVIWTRDGRAVRRFAPSARFGGYANGAEFTADGRFVAGVFDDGSVLLAATDGSSALRRKIADVPLNGVACSPRGRLGAVAGADGVVRLLDLTPK